MHWDYGKDFAASISSNSSKPSEAFPVSRHRHFWRREEKRCFRLVSAGEVKMSFVGSRIFSRFDVIQHAPVLRLALNRRLVVVQSEVLMGIEWCKARDIRSHACTSWQILLDADDS